ncbi:TniB family NTP-binding protein [Microvirga sp. 17 mud 1-3]|uniref:TniB family NTP-binding protein n=1 Tax=Microvirga sp. 17 mud 1-3 TaxID=2082949 RepID=UPI000D6BA57C|nr:TniB family NTP-binding protein [Microvirga sp. 17 mud 1-3]AWM85502.1 hypothetical protein C4E04_01225 [Microvirga sp. 17 mud 1-3]
MDTLIVPAARQPVPNPWAQLQTVFVAHPMFDDIMEEIEDVLALHGSADEVPCLQITGETGIGKTTLFKKLRARYPVVPDGLRTSLPSGLEQVVDYVPLLSFEMPSQPRVIPVARAMLKALGDPLWKKGRREDLEDRVDLYLKACGTVGILIDEAQRAVDRNGVLSAGDLIDWIKTRHSVSGVSFIMLGLPRMRVLVEEDEQFDRRWDNELTMDPYDWGADEVDEPESRAYFIGLLVAFRDASPIPFAPEVDVLDDRVAKRFFYVCRGVIGRLKKLLLMAMRVAMRRSEPGHIDLALLEKAFDKAFRKDKAFEKLINPFGPEWNGQLPPKPRDDRSPIRRPRSKANQVKLRRSERNMAVTAALTKTG